MTSEALVSFLSNGCLKLSFGLDANDPFELLTARDIPDSPKRVDEGFISFTKNENDPHMWGIYADKYRGARLEFRFLYRKRENNSSEEQYEFLRRWFKDENGGEHWNDDEGDVIYKCHYTRERPKSCLAGRRKPTPREIRNWIRICNTSKHFSWENEDEYRMLFSCKRDLVIKARKTPPLYLIPGFAPILKSIVLGPRCNLLLSYVKYNLCKNKILAPGQRITYSKAEFPKNGGYDLFINPQPTFFPPVKEN